MFVGKGIGEGEAQKALSSLTRRLVKCVVPLHFSVINSIIYGLKCWINHLLKKKETAQLN